MMKLGFIDYFLDEWHANNYPGWIRSAGRGFEIAYAWAEADKPGGMTTEEWCARYAVERAASREELIDRCDGVVVLSPDNPERHEALAAQALRSGKPVYVDKTFATDLASAERMFALAEKHNTPLYSTSALRYASELRWLKDNGVAQAGVRFASARGPGIFENYSIHQIEMIVAAMGTGAKRAIALGAGDAPLVAYEYAGGRCSAVNLLPWSGFSLTVQDGGARGASLDIVSDFWPAFIESLLCFFETGVPPVPRAETCEAVAMVEAGMAALRHPGVWADVAKR